MGTVEARKGGRALFAAVVFCAVTNGGFAAPDLVNAADFGYSPLNATKALQAAINSGARRVVVDAAPGEWCLEPIRLRSNLELVFGAGVCVRAVPGAYRGRFDMMFTGRGVTNVTIRGEDGASLSMCKVDYLDASRYEWSEWRHLLAFYDCGDVAVSNLVLSASGGDGVYIARCRNVRLENVLCADHDRQGVSVIGAENLLIRRCRFCCTSGTPPQCGIDFEPNSKNRTETFVSNVVEQCEFDGNASAGVCLHIPNLTSQRRPMSVTFRDCRIRGNKSGVRMYVAWNDSTAVRGTVEFERCVISGNRDGALQITAMPPDKLAVNFTDCLFDCRGCAATPIVFDNGSVPFDFGNVSFRNVRMYADREETMAFYGMTGVGMTNLYGSLSLTLPDGKTVEQSLAAFAAMHRPDPAARAFKPATVTARQLVPVAPDATPTPDPIFCRGRQTFIQSVPGPGRYTFKFFTKQTGDRPPEVEVSVSDRVGTAVESFTVREPEKEYVLTATTPNIYTFNIRSRVDFFAVSSPYPGHGLRADIKPRIHVGKGRNLWFVVPAKSKEVRFEVSIRNRMNPLTAKILDGSGAVRATLDKAAVSQILKVPRAPTAADEIWCFAASECDGVAGFELRIGGNAVAVLSDASDACLKYGPKGVSP